MERIKEALDKARQERQLREGTSPTPVSIQFNEHSPDNRSSPQRQTEIITVDDAVLKENRIVLGIEPGPFTDSYNLLRTQVLQRFKENDWSVLAVTSPSGGEGKTLTAINLAVSIAREVNYTVLLVDANLRHPWMLEHFGLPQRKGLSDYLTSNVPIEELLVKPSRVEHLVLLPGGQRLEHSAEMLSSPKMEQLVKDMKSRYRSRIIIFDLPPVLSSADALAFSPYVDAALLVVEDGVTQKDDLQNAVDLLATTNIIGTVLNKSESKKS